MDCFSLGSVLKKKEKRTNGGLAGDGGGNRRYAVGEGD
jgi:hypothetical protein